MESRELIWISNSDVFKLFEYFGFIGRIPVYRSDNFQNAMESTGLDFVCVFDNKYEKHNQWLPEYRYYYIFEICDRIKWFTFILKSGISYQPRPTITEGWEIVPYKEYENHTLTQIYDFISTKKWSFEEFYNFVYFLKNSNI